MSNPTSTHTAIDPTILPDFATMPNVALMDTNHVDKNEPPFILVDGSYYLFRTYHALPEMTTSKGLHTNAIKGTLNALNKLMRRYHPTHMAVAFDTKSPTFRHEMSDLYKANRPPMDEELRQQLPYIHKLVKALGIPMLHIEGAEADDIIGTLARRAVEQGHHVVISTGDKDMAQLVNDAVVLEDSFKGVVTDVAGVNEKFEVSPNQIIDYLTLMGDASDGIKGVPKVGKKTAVKLLKEYGTLSNILKNAPNIKGVVGKNLVEFANNTITDKQMATIVTNMDIGTNWDELKINTNPTAHINELRALYTELEFKKDLDSLNHPNHPANSYPANIDHQGIAPNQQSQTKLQETEDAPKAWHTVLDQPAFDTLLKRLASASYFAFDTETTSLNWREAEIVGVSVALQANEAYYIPLAHGLTKKDETPTLELEEQTDPLIAKQLDRKMVLAQLKPILENPKTHIVGQHLKYDAHVLSSYGINLYNGSNEQMATKSVTSRKASEDSTSSTASEHDKDGGICSPIWSDTMLASYVLNAAATRHGMDALAKHYLNKDTIKYEDIAGKGAKQITFDKVAIDIASDYACEDADITLQLYELFAEKLKEDENNTRLLEKLEIPTAQILTKMEANGILINRDFLSELSQRFDQQISELEQAAYKAVGEEFNLSSPKQLGEMLFDKLGLKGGKKTKSGQYSTSESVLAKIDHPVVDTVLEYRSLSKLKNTYTDALGRVADPVTDRIHTSYHQALTTTGRLSSTDPNLQNIPIRTATGRLIRQAFIAPQTPNKRVIMAADYSQIELRLMAHFSGDETLIESFRQGLDIHTATAAEVLGKPIEDITHAERRNAKAINFGLLYGMSQFGLAKQLGLTRQEAQDYIDLYFARYPKVKDYMQTTRTNAYDYGYVETILKRKLYTPDIQNSNRMVKQGAERAAINAPLQGSAADIIKLAMIAVDKVLTDKGYDNHAKMLLQVHDELVFEVDEDKSDEIGTLIQTAMQNVLTNTAKELGWQVDFAVPLVVKVDKGDNWDEAH